MASISIPTKTNEIPSTTNEKIIIACPKCSTKYKVSASLQGKKAVCRKCQFQMPIVPAPTRTARKRVQPPVSNQVQVRSGESPNYRHAGLGLILKASSDIVAAVALGILLPIGLFAESMVVAYSFVTLMYGSILLAIVGTGLCFTIPHRAKSKRFIAISTASALAAIVMIYGFGILDLVTYSVLGTSFLFFMFFLKRTAHNSGRSDLASMARNILIVHLIAGVVSIGLPFLAMIPAFGLPVISIHLSAITIVVMVSNAIAGIVLQMQLGIHLRNQVK